MNDKTEIREYGDCMLRIRSGSVGARYTIVGSKKTILDFVVWHSGERTEQDQYPPETK